MSNAPKHASFWNATTEPRAYAPLAADVVADVAVIGAGITGLTAALELKRAGLKVVVLDQLPHIGAGMTGHTTAHLTQVFDTGLAELERSVGRDGARAVWEAGRLAIDHMQDVAHGEGFDCDFKRVPGYLYASHERHLDGVREEIRLARELGFPADFVSDAPFPQMRLGAMRVANQAQFHAGKYLQGLARRVDGGGSAIHTSSHVSAVHHGDPVRVEANGYVVRVQSVVYATQQPIHDRLFTAKVPAYDTYAVGARVAKGTFPHVLAWDTEDPYHYWRLAPAGDADMLIVGGEDHRTGHADDAHTRHERLIAYMKACLGDIPFEVAFLWQGQWVSPVDGVPFIGATGRQGEYVATGFSGNGMTLGTYGGLLITDLILGREHPAARLFDPQRLNVRAGVVTFLSENLTFPAHLVKDRLKHPQLADLEAIGPRQGAIVELDGEKLAAYRNERGEVTACSAVCTHMGCLVHFNDAQQMWECPCHGSIFDTDGSVVAGPALRPLAQVDLKAMAKKR